MANENCLEGMRCPDCGSDGPFNIAAHAWFEVHDDGTGNYEGVEWDDDARAVCLECKTEDRVEYFKGAPRTPQPDNPTGA